MELQAFEVQVNAKAETKGLKMAFFVKISSTIFSAILNCFRANQIECEQMFDKLTLKDMDALKKQIQPLVDYVLSHCFWTYAMLSKY